MSNGANALAEEMGQGEWEGTNGEWTGEIPDISEIRDIEQPVDLQRQAWRQKIEFALRSLRRDEEVVRQTILKRSKIAQDMVMECED